MLTVMRRVAGWIDSRPGGTVERWLFALVVLFVWGLNTHGNYAGSGDEPHYQIIARSLVSDGDFDLADDYSDPANLVGGGNLQPEAHARPGRDGRLRPVHDIGLPALFAPYFAAAYWAAEHSPEWVSPAIMARARLNPPLVLRHLLSLAMIVLTAVMAILLFRACRSECATHSPAFGWVLLFVLSPPLLSHSFLFFTEVPTALAVTVCWLALAAPLPPSRVRMAAIGGVVGILLLLHIRNAGLILGLIVLFLGRIWHLEHRGSLAAWFLGPIALFAAFRTAVNAAFWGTLVTSPHASASLPGGLVATVTEIASRVFGLLVDQEHGLLAYAPVYLLVLPGFFLLRRTGRRGLRDASVLVLAYLVPVVLPGLNRHGWAGGWSPAARFLVPVAPILVIVGFRYAARLRRIPVAIALLCLAQVALDLLYWSRPKLLWNAGTGSSALAEYLSTPGLDVAAWLPSWHVPSLYSAAVSLSVILAWTLLSARAASKAVAKPNAARPAVP